VASISISTVNDEDWEKLPSKLYGGLCLQFKRYVATALERTAAPARGVVFLHPSSTEITNILQTELRKKKTIELKVKTILVWIGLNA
jgi:hypothetical protein